MINTKLVIAIVEPSYIIRKGMVYALSQLDEVTKVIEIQSLDTLKNQYDIHRPDVLVINPILLGQSTRQDLKLQLNVEKDTVVLALINNLLDEQVHRSYDGVIMINDSKAKISSVVIDSCSKKQNTVNDQEELSEREIEILISVVKGMSNKEIADFHNISIHTVITHRRNITRKLKVHSISGLTIYAIINNLIDISDIQYQDK